MGVSKDVINKSVPTRLKGKLPSAMTTNTIIESKPKPPIVKQKKINERAENASGPDAKSRGINPSSIRTMTLSSCENIPIKRTHHGILSV